MHRFRKYAAKSEQVDRTKLHQRVYLRFLYAKRAVCSGVPEFAAYFRRAISEVRGKTEISRPDPSFAATRPAVLLPKIGLCSEVSDFSPHFRKTRLNRASRSGKPAEISFSPIEILVLQAESCIKRRYEKAIGVASPAAQLLSAGSGCHNGL